MPEWWPVTLAVVWHNSTLRAGQAGSKAEEYGEIQKGGADNGQENVEVMGDKAELLVLFINPALFTAG